MVNALKNGGFVLTAVADGRAILRRGDRNVVVRMNEKLGPGALAVLLRTSGMSRAELEVLLGERIPYLCA
jgi:predicted RNA binding protein YcfA (HicA-like mRNA interferase family)